MVTRPSGRRRHVDTNPIYEAVVRFPCLLYRGPYLGAVGVGQAELGPDRSIERSPVGPGGLGRQQFSEVAGVAAHLRIFVTLPAPTVRPPSRMAKRRPSSMAIGAIRSTTMVVLSPGMTISVPSARLTAPVTSVVRK